MAIPSIITDASITFVAKGRAWTMASDHANFQQVRNILSQGQDVDPDDLVHLVDVRVAVADATGGAAELTEDGLFLDGKALSAAWAEKAVASPLSMKVLKVSSGDRIKVAGDEDAPDGIYVVGSTDDEDAESRIYVESDDGFF